MTPKELYARIYPVALAAYAQKNSDAESAKQMAHALAKEVVDQCCSLGVFGEVATSAEGQVRGRGIGDRGVPAFAETRPAGTGAVPVMPAGAPQQAAQHYNHVAVGGREIVPPTGGQYIPPDQAGVMNHVVHVPTPESHSALGTDGVISQPVQRPNSSDTVVAPAQKSMIPAIGGNGTTFVPERIVR
jgi:hypothetical protein